MVTLRFRFIGVALLAGTSRTRTPRSCCAEGMRLAVSLNLGELAQLSSACVPAICNDSSGFKQTLLGAPHVFAQTETFEIVSTGWMEVLPNNCLRSLRHERHTPRRDIFAEAHVKPTRRHTQTRFEIACCGRPTELAN